MPAGGVTGASSTTTGVSWALATPAMRMIELKIVFEIVSKDLDYSIFAEMSYQAVLAHLSLS